MKISRNNLIFWLILLFINIIISKSSNYYEFKYPKNEEILKINNLEYVNFYGQIEIIEGDNFEIYCYSYSFEIKEDDNGNLINYNNFYNNSYPGRIEDIKISEQYMIIKGKGYISFGANNITILNVNNITILQLPYDLNNKYYQLDGNGNTLEIVLDNGNVCFYLNNICHNTNEIINNISGKQIINIRNINNAKDTNIKFLYTIRKEIYSIDQEQGDKIYCLLINQYKFIVKESLAKQYYALKEGILKITGNPYVEFNKEKYISDDDNGLYYFIPESEIIEIYLTNADEGEISIVGINPTIEMNFPKSIITQINQSIGPQYLRIEIYYLFDQYNEEYILEFGNYVEIVEGTMFKNGDLNKGFYSSNLIINKNHAGKIYTVIYKTSGTFSYKKIFNWIELKEFEIMQIILPNYNEITFKYNQNKTKNVLLHFEEGYKSSYVNIYIYTSEENIKYNATSRLYSGHYKALNFWKELEIDKSTIYLIIQTKDYGYNDYISFRNGNILLKNEDPHTIKEFNELNFIVYILDLEYGNNNIEILSTIRNTFTISLYEEEIEKQICIEYSCQFKVMKENNKKHFIFIKNINNKIKEFNKELYILQYQELDYYTISNNGFLTKYFLFPFEFKFKLSSEFFSNFQLTKELNINYRYSLELNKYNVTINITNISKNYILTSDKIDNYNYEHYYINFNQNNISELIISVRGNWNIDSFLPYENISFSFGGPFYIVFPEYNPPKINNSIGNIIFYTIINRNIDKSKKYLFSLPSKTKLLKGKLFTKNEELNNEYKPIRKYMLDNEIFENDSEYTFEFKNQINGEVYYELLNGQILLNKNYVDYKTYELDFRNNDNIYYLGLYNDNIEIYAYVDNEDNTIAISYKNDNSNLNPVLPNESHDKLNDFFFPLNTQYNIIKFSWKNENRNKTNKEFIIFDPNLIEENLYYSKQGKFYLKKGKEKIIKLEKNNIEKSDIYRIVTRSHNKMVDLTINSNNIYTLNSANSYTNIWEISKNEDFLYKAISSSHTLLYSKVLEGSIYKVLYLKNATTIVEKSNNILIKIGLLKNVGYIDLIIKNIYKNNFYYIIYPFDKNKNELRRLILPIFNTNSTKINFKSDSDKINISKLNPIYDQQYNNKFNDSYLAISYEQDFENPKESPYEVSIVYRKITNQGYSFLDDNTPLYIKHTDYDYFEFNRYSLKRKQYSNLVLNFISYGGVKSSNITFFKGIGLLRTIDLWKKYTQVVIDKEDIIDDLDIEYNIAFLEEYKGFCLQFFYSFTDEKIDINEFENIENKLYITVKGNIISWEKLDNVKKYIIYMGKNVYPYEKLSLFSNDCYLRELNKGYNDDIITTEKNSYKFKKETQTLIVTVVALEEKYGMRIVYNPIEYSYYNNEDDNSFIIIFFSVFGGILIIICIIKMYQGIKRSNKEQEKNNNKDYGISMVEDCHPIISPNDK